MALCDTDGHHYVIWPVTTGKKDVPYRDVTFCIQCGKPLLIKIPEEG